MVPPRPSRVAFSQVSGFSPSGRSAMTRSLSKKCGIKGADPRQVKAARDFRRDGPCQTRGARRVSGPMSIPNHPGILPCQAIEALIANGAIRAPEPFAPDQVQPASLALRLGDYAWRARASFLPGAGRTVAERLADVAMHRLDLTGGAVLERGCVYIAPVQEVMALPPGHFQFTKHGHQATLAWLPDTARVPVSGVTGKGAYSRHSVTMKLGGAALLFCIQTSLWAYLQPAAASVGMSMTQLSHLLALGAAINLLAPIAAERLGERLGRSLPFLAGFLALGASAFLVAGQVGITAYSVGVVGLSFSTLFLGPFVMASLLRLDSSGGIAAGAPAFFMIRLAIGPALGAAILNSIGLGGLAAFGVLAALVASLLFVCDTSSRDELPLRR